MKVGLWILLLVAGAIVVWFVLAYVVGWLSYALGFALVLGLLYVIYRLVARSPKPSAMAPKAERKIEKAAVRELKELEKQQKQTLGRKP